ncbi:MAG: formate--tetrahydrofolate ligase [Candidatus Thermoplasmatota archaeon]|jgi:formate--tetrahydrofolate ligase|nr:formate--tetrahydrofolate ligase [Candidatus Thermoplasmatota archaeon]
MKTIKEISKEIGLEENDIEPYGNYMGKISLKVIKKLEGKKDGKLVLVTAINPTSSGEGKTTTTIGLSQGLRSLGKSVMITLREPSLGPNFGVKGGGTGGGKCQVLPSDEINLNFTGDFPAISAAHNLLSAIVNNHIFHGNELNLDVRKLNWRRTIDMNDRSLRQIVVGMGEAGGAIAEDSFLITPASEIMAIMGFADSYSSLKEMLSRITVGYTKDGKRVTAGDLKAQGAMASLLKNAIKPNLVQTNEGVPALVHIGPFGNIAHGHNSITADRIALKLADYVITEAGFGSDLGAQKFIDIVSRRAGYRPSLSVIVITVKALKHHGGMKKGQDGLDFLVKGMENLYYHIENMRRYSIPVVLALNKFSDDKEEEIEYIRKELQKRGYELALNEGYLKGGVGSIELAKLVLKTLQSTEPSQINYTYEPGDPVKTKIEKIARNVYGAKEVEFSKKAMAVLKQIKMENLDFMDVCIAKTQYSITDDQTKLGWPKDFVLKIQDIMLSTGVGFAVPLSGEIMTMPGLPKHPISEEVDIDEEGNITGLL